jgi:hypothetical protein
VHFGALSFFTTQLPVLRRSDNAYILIVHARLDDDEQDFFSYQGLQQPLKPKIMQELRSAGHKRRLV